MLHNGMEFGQEADLPEGGDTRVMSRPLEWSLAGDEIGRTLHTLYRRLADIRLAHPALRTGTFRPRGYDERTGAFDGDGYGVDTGRGLAVYARQGARPVGGGLENLVVALNFSGVGHQVALPFPHEGKWRELLDGGPVEVTGPTAEVFVPSHWGRIFVDTT
jgi:hypothetical protein